MEASPTRYVVRHDESAAGVRLQIATAITARRMHRFVDAMKKPTFFIIGAPKCGTTSLAAWLADHPDIFMSPTKEPHYFNTDHKRYLNSLAGYEQLFEDATDRHSAVGEASVWYLYSANAVENI